MGRQKVGHDLRIKQQPSLLMFPGLGRIQPPSSDALGLAKKFARGHPYHVAENPNDLFGQLHSFCRPAGFQGGRHGGGRCLATAVAHPGGGPLSHPSASGEPVLPAPVPAPGPGGCKRPAPHARAHPGRPARCAPRGAHSCALSLPRRLIAAADAGPRPDHLRGEARKPRGPLGRAKPQLGGFHHRAL